MTRTVFICVLIACAAGLWANDIAVSAPDGRGGWLLLENPPGVTGQGLSEFAGDPGMPAPDAHRWPHALRATKDGKGVEPYTDGKYPATELWFFADGKYTRATHFLGGADETRPTYRRALIAVVTIAGEPYVLHLDNFKLYGGLSQLVRVDETSPAAGGVLPPASIVLNSPDFIDAPAVSPDGKHIAFRAFAGTKILLRVFSTETWKLVAESEARTFARPVWIDASSLAVIAWDGAIPEAPQRDTSLRFSIRTLESHTPAPGKLLRLNLADGKLTTAELLSASFPPDRYTRTVLADPKGLGLLVASEERKKVDGKEIVEVVAEQREPKAGGRTRELGRYEVFRGFSSSDAEVRSAGVREIDRADTFVVNLATRSETPPEELHLAQLSTAGHGGLIDLGHGAFGVLEAVVNPEFEPGITENVQLLRHTLRVFTWPGCDTMRNPRVLQQLSKLVRRFNELGNVKSTLLAFDVEIAGNQGKNQKKGRYIELYSATGRKNRGAIRTEDNLSGSWLVQSVEGGGEAATDDYYSWAGNALNPPKMDSKPAANAGKAYDDLVTQLEARKLLMLNGVEADWGSGGLTFLGRGSYRDPTSGATWRTWIFEKYGRVLDEEKYKAAEAKLKLEGADTGAIIREMRELRERIEIRFVADLPIGSAGDWKFPHAIAQVKLRFALSNQQKAAVTELTFEPDRWVALPNLVELGTSGKRGTELLLPKVFRIYGRNAQGNLVEELKATAVAEKFDHKAELVNGAKLTPGYNVPLANVNANQFTNVKR